MKRITILLLTLFCCFASRAEQNPTPSPDGALVAYTDAGNLYVRDVASGEVKALTSDGTDLISSGYASWVYYEEILGRPSKYRAFWWSPDSRKIAFMRFDNSGVPMFPIYDAMGQNGSLTQTRYPKAGQKNPEVRIGIADIATGAIVWADFDQTQDQYFGLPFFRDGSDKLYVQWMPRVQNSLSLFAVDVENGSKSLIYHEQYKTWVDWMEDMLFGKDGLYMVRAFETGWEQIYYLSYDGKQLRRLTGGRNWKTSLIALDEKKGTVYFTSQRDSDVRSALYKVDRKGRITTLSDTAFDISGVDIESDFKSYKATISNLRTPSRRISQKIGAKSFEVLEDRSPEGFDSSDPTLPQIIRLTLPDGLSVPAKISYPKGFDPESGEKYPLVMEIYGGPGTQYVVDSWRNPRAMDRFFADNGYIKVTADCRAAGHNGRAGTDLVHLDVVSVPVEDFTQWARYFASLPYVGKIGVTGFSFGGTMTTMLVMTHPDDFACGVAGGGVYDWILYDTHYTERFMDTPQRNPEGYSRARVLNYVESYDPSKSYLKLTHGTSDDNVHFQGTLQLIDALQRLDKQFDLMIYPGGMHGYRGRQATHDNSSDKIFWNNHLK